MKSILLLTFLSFFIPTNGRGQSFSIRGLVTDGNTHKPIKGASIRKIGSDSSDYSVVSDSMGNYFFDSTFVKPNTSYTLSAEAKSLEYPSGNKRMTLTTGNLINSKIFIENLELVHSDYPCEDIPVVLFKLGKSELTQLSKDSVLSIWIKIMKDNPRITIELDGHVSKNEKRLDLSKNRADTCKTYLVLKKIDPDRITTEGVTQAKTNKPCVTFRILRFDYIGKNKK